MIAYVNRQPVRWSAMTYREPGFGQPLAPEMLAVPYQALLTPEEFRSSFKDVFDKFVAEIEVDDRIYGDVQTELANQGYARYDELMQTDRIALAGIICRLLPLELAAACFSSHDRSLWLYAVNTIDKVSIDDARVEITGYAYSLVQARRWRTKS